MYWRWARACHGDRTSVNLLSYLFYFGLTIDQTIPASVKAQSQKQRIKEFERENRELKQANEIIRKAAAFFA